MTPRPWHKRWNKRYAQHTKPNLTHRYLGIDVPQPEPEVSWDPSRPSSSTSLFTTPQRLRSLTRSLKPLTLVIGSPSPLLSACLLVTPVAVRPPESRHRTSTTGRPLATTGNREVRPGPVPVSLGLHPPEISRPRPRRVSPCLTPGVRVGSGRLLGLKNPGEGYRGRR